MKQYNSTIFQRYIAKYAAITYESKNHGTNCSPMNQSKSIRTNLKISALNFMYHYLFSPIDLQEQTSKWRKVAIGNINPCRKIVSGCPKLVDMIFLNIFDLKLFEIDWKLNKKGQKSTPVTLIKCWFKRWFKLKST